MYNLELFAANTRSLQEKTVISKDFATFVKEAKVAKEETKEFFFSVKMSCYNK